MPGAPPKPLHRGLLWLGLTALACATLLFLAGPLLLYAWGLTLFADLPDPPTRIRDYPELTEAWEAVERSSQITVQRLHPWSLVGKLAFGDLETAPGQAASVYVSGKLVHEALGKTPNPTWHLANHSLSIWLTRNWTPVQLAEEVARIEERRLSGIQP